MTKRRVRTHCKNGHEFTPENSYVRKDGGTRGCRRCRTDAVLRYTARRKAEVEPRGLVYDLGSAVERLAQRSHAQGDCRIWTGAKTHNGYGTMSIRPVDGGLSKDFRVHRVAYELVAGPIPPGLHLDHLCGNRACINPEHLEPVTPGENTLRSNRIGYGHMGWTCKNGHDWRDVPPYEHQLKSGRIARRCRICTRERVNERRRLMREAAIA